MNKIFVYPNGDDFYSWRIVHNNVVNTLEIDGLELSMFSFEYMNNLPKDSKFIEVLEYDE